MTRLARLLLALALSLLTGWPAGAAPPVPPSGWSVQRWGEADGLPGADVFSLARLPEGRLLLGTSDGLAFFDGRRIRVLRAHEPDGPPDDRSLWVFDDGSGAVWVVTEAGRVQRRGPEGVKNYGLVAGSNGPFHPWVIPGRGVFLLLPDGVVQLDDPPRRLPGWPGGLGTMTEKDGRLYAGNGADWWVQERPGGPVKPVDWHPTRADLAHRTAHFTLSADGRRILQDGVVLLESDRLFKDVLEIDGSLWIASGGWGLLHLSRSPLRVHTVAPGEPGATATAHVQRDAATGHVWAQGIDEGEWWDVDDGITLPDTRGLRPVSPSRSGPRWWLGQHGTWKQRSDPRAPLRAAPAPPGCIEPAWSFLPLPGGGALTGSGLRLEDGRWSRLPGACQAPWKGVRAMVRLPGVGVLFGGYGLHLLDPDGRVLEVSAPAGVRPRHLRTGRGRVWMATENHGLCTAPIDTIGSDTLAWRCLSHEAGFPERQVHASFEDALGRLWISTNRGLRVVLARDVDAWLHGETAAVPSLDASLRWGPADPELNGFAGSSGLRTADGHLWFPGAAGVLEVRPEEFGPPEALRVRLGDVRVGDRRCLAPPCTLAPGEALSFEIVALPLEWASQVDLRYRVGEGAWRPVEGGRIALYALPPGDGRIAVQARLLGPWRDAAALTFHRTPAILERTSTLVGAVTLAAVAVWGMLVLRNRRLARHERELERQVRERTAELASRNGELRRQAEELAELHATVASQAKHLEEMDRLNKKMVADIAHELRTPLTLVVGSLERLSEREAARGALRQVGRLLELVDELSALADADGGTLQLRARRVVLRELLADTVERFRDAFHRQGRELAVSCPETIALEADPHLLDRAIGNLVVNGLRHGAGTVEVRATAANDGVLVEVRDEGPGIPPEHRERIFERFVQVEGGDTRPHEGSGIGLALVREIVTLHGGRVRADDAHGGGACFRVWLPRSAPAVLPPEPPTDAPEPHRRGRFEILVVEDHPDIRAHLAEILGEAHRVRCARDGAEGLRLVREGRPDVIVCDVRMPEMDGLTLVRKLRASPDTATIRVLLVSAKTRPEDRVEGLSVADDYLCKPFSAAELRARVARLLPPEARVDRPAHEEAFLERLDALCRDNLCRPDFGAAELARALGMSLRSLQDRLRRLGRPSPARLLLEARLEEARRLLREGQCTAVSEVASRVGLSRSYFSRAYRSWAGRAPSEDLFQRPPQGR